MPDKQTPPFRADHVGSLLRPPQLLAAREQAKAGRLPAGELRKVEDEAIRGVARMQEELGLHGITDGEFRRACLAHGFPLSVRRRHQGSRTR